MKKMQSVCYMVAFFLCVLCLFFAFSQRQDSRGAEGGLRDIPGQTAITRAGHGEHPDCFQTVSYTHLTLPTNSLV